MRQDKDPNERRLVPRTDDPRLFWLDELFDTDSEREERQKLKDANMAKWGKILSQSDTFDDSVVPEGGGSSSGGASGSGELIVVGGSVLALAVLAAAAFAS